MSLPREIAEDINDITSEYSLPESVKLKLAAWLSDSCSRELTPADHSEYIDNILGALQGSRLNDNED